MANLLSSDTVADFFLVQIDPAAGDTISNLKLQKLVYYAQAWHLAIHKKPLFAEQIEAWAHGPVVPELYHRFKKFGWGAIDSLAIKTEPYSDLHASDVKLLEEIWAKYGQFTAKQLETLTHRDDPWRLAYGNTRPGGRCTEKITHDVMREYYSKRLKQAA
jgi:uncharacterized phage-associated protein